MTDARNRWPLLGATLLGLSPSRLAAAQSGPCSGPEITLAVPAAEQANWRTLRANLNEHLRTLHDLDRCAQLTVRTAGDSLVLEVRASDGRVASRTVENEAQLLSASDALLTLPPPLPSSRLTASAAESPPPPEPSTSAPPPAAHVELGAGASARMGGLPLFVAGGVAGFADLALRPWQLGVSARWDITTGLLGEPTLTDYYLMSTAVGAQIGRRFELESTSLDLLLGPNLVLETQDADDGQRDIRASATDVRIDLRARLSGPRHSNWRAFASADLELSPARLASEHFAHPGLPPLPSFSLGLALGVLWSGK